MPLSFPQCGLNHLSLNILNFHADLKVVKEHMGARGDIAGIYGAKRVEAGLKSEN